MRDDSETSIVGHGGQIICSEHAAEVLSIEEAKISPLDGAGHPTPGSGMRANRASAQATALAVERKFTASLLSHPARSSVAPSRLSKNKPKTPPAQLTRINDGSR